MSFPASFPSVPYYTVQLLISCGSWVTAAMVNARVQIDKTTASQYEENLLMGK